VRDSGLGVVANPDDPLDIAKKLVQMRREIRANRFPSAAKAELLARFNRRNLAKRLADLFCEVQLPTKA